MDQQAVDQTRDEDEIYNPPPSITESANVKQYDAIYQRSLEDPEGFWAERAQELEWYEPWDQGAG